MTPEESKAQELVERFGLAFGENYGFSLDKAKQCALIAVDEIFNFMQMDDEFNKDCHMANTHWLKYWQSVKEYIEKL